MSNRLLWMLVALFAVVKMALVGWWPFLALPHLQHDTQIFINQAISILEGNWLGPYSEFTLMKGPATPIWIALMNFLGIPLLMSHHLIFLGASILLMLAFRRLTSSNGFLLFVFVLALFSPFTFNYGAIASAFRGMLHQPLVLGLIALSIILFCDFIKDRGVNTSLCILFGVILFLFWINREEGVWIVPWLLWLIVVMIAHTYIHRQTGDSLSVSRLAGVVLIPAAIWAVGTTAIAWKNYQEYEVFSVVELKTPQFKRAFGNLLGIKAENWHPRYAAPTDVLDKLYALPSGGELNLDHKENETRKPILSLKLPWSFRTAVADAGYYAMGGRAVLEFYNRIGSDIEAACERGEFDCADPLFGVFPPWHSGYTERFPRTLWRVLQRALNIDFYKTIQDFNSTGTPRDRLFISRLVNSPIRAIEADGDRSSPDFYFRLKKNKTKYSVKITGIYRIFTPTLFWIALAGLVLALFSSVRNKKLSNLDSVYLGIAGTILVQLVMLTILSVTGYSSSIRMYFLFYPVLYTFIALGMLSITRNIRSLFTENPIPYFRFRSKQ